MSSDTTSPQAGAKSPIFAAIGLSLAIGLGAVLGTTDIATIEDVVTGRWLTRSYTDTQQAHTVAIAALEQTVAFAARDIDFVAARAGASIRHGEDRSAERFAQLDAEIAALKEKLAGIEFTQLMSRSDAPARPVANAGEAAGLRSSLTELTAAHHNSVAAITRRLDRIEVKVGLSTDVAAPVANAARKTIRRAVKMKRPLAPPTSDPIAQAPFGGPLFTVRPVSQRGPLRLSKLPD